MIRRTLLVASLLVASAALGACGGDTGLIARGAVEVDTGTARTGFSFPNDVRIDGVDDTGVGRVRGLCELHRVYDDPSTEQYGVVVEILRGFESEEQGLASLTVMQRTDAFPEEGRVEVELGTTPYASRDGECHMEIEYAVADGGMLGLSGACEVYDADGNAASAVVTLDFAGCAVVE